MKYFRQLFSFTLSAALLMGSAPVYAESTQSESRKPATKYSAHAYNPNDFCKENGAEKLMKELEEANAERFEQIAAYKEEIATLVESDKLIAATRDIKTRYLNSLTEIAKEEKPGVVETVKDKAGSVLSTLAEKLKIAQAVKIDAAVLESVSTKAKLSTVSTEPLVKEASEKYALVKSSLPLELSTETQSKVDNIVGEIPEEVSTGRILEIYKNSSPTFNKLLSKKFTEEEVLACLEENISKDACAKLGISPEEKVTLVENISADLRNLTSHVSSKVKLTALEPETGKGVLTPAELERRRRISERKRRDIVETRSAMGDSLKDLGKFTLAETAKKTEETNGRQRQLNRSVQDKAQELMVRNEKKLVGTDIFFYNPPSDEKYKALGIDTSTQEGAATAIKMQEKAISNAIADAAIFNKDCNFSAEAAASIPPEQVNICHGLVSKIIPKIDNLRDSHMNRVIELNTKVQKLTNDNNFADTENLKKYVAEKYMCSCKSEDAKKIRVNKEKESLVLTGESCSTQFLTLSKIEGLSNASSAIANALYAHEIKVPTDGNSCAMTPQRLKPFSDTCSAENTFINGKFPQICDLVKSEYVEKVQLQEVESKRNAKWEKYNEENYVEYNSKSPTGYTAVKKKSTWRVIGEGVLPVLPNAVPIWLGNYQMKHNIDMLTDQAMLQKQYLHNVDIYNQSPWMYNYNYFGYGNPFMQTTPLTGGTSLGGSAGFNFGI